ncbi:MAG: CHASE3 domain-containing protein [Solirubrobacteraceae bacterium]
MAVAAAAVFVVIALAASDSSQKAQDASRSIATAANGLLVDLLNAETGQRGYLLTGRPNYLQPYHAGVAAIPGDLRALGSLTVSHPALAASTARLRTLSAAKLAVLARAISLNESGDRRAALALVNTGEGMRTMDLARAQVSALLAGAAALVRGPRSRARRAADIAIVVDGAVFLLVVALGLRWRAHGRRSERARIAGERERDRLAQAVELSADAIMSFASLEGGVWICDWSAGAERLFGFSGREMVGLSMQEFNALAGEGAEADPRVAQLAARVLAGETVRYETRRRRKDGAMIDLQVALSPWRVDGKIVGLTSVSTDITERKVAERELERLAQAAEYGADAVISFDRELRIRHWNAGAERIYGYGAAEVLGLKTSEVAALVSQSTQAIADFRRKPECG